MCDFQNVTKCDAGLYKHTRGAKCIGRLYCWPLRTCSFLIFKKTSYVLFPLPRKPFFPTYTPGENRIIHQIGHSIRVRTHTPWRSPGIESADKYTSGARKPIFWARTCLARRDRKSYILLPFFFFYEWQSFFFLPNLLNNNKTNNYECVLFTRSCRS